MCNISLTLKEQADISIEIFDNLGRKIQQINRDNAPAGKHIVEWDGTDTSGNQLAKGVYMLKITANDFSETLRLIKIE